MEASSGSLAKEMFEVPGQVGWWKRGTPFFSSCKVACLKDDVNPCSTFCKVLQHMIRARSLRLLCLLELNLSPEIRLQNRSFDWLTLFRSYSR